MTTKKVNAEHLGRRISEISHQINLAVVAWERGVAELEMPIAADVPNGGKFVGTPAEHIRHRLHELEQLKKSELGLSLASSSMAARAERRAEG